MSLNLEPLSVEDNSNVSANERQIMEEVARPRDELVALASDLIAFDTTTRERNDDPARDERALQEYFAARLRAAGAETDLWEPVPEDVAGSPKTPSGMRFDGRPRLAARFSRQAEVAACFCSGVDGQARLALIPAVSTADKPRPHAKRSSLQQSSELSKPSHKWRRTQPSASESA